VDDCASGRLGGWETWLIGIDQVLESCGVFGRADSCLRNFPRQNDFGGLLNMIDRKWNS
jgi:hypothetical protein